MTPSDADSDFLEVIARCFGGEVPSFEPPPFLLQTAVHPDLSWILRPHWEASVEGDATIQQRTDTDEWLDLLLRLELLIAAGVAPLLQAETLIPQSARDGLALPPVQRFIDDYDYFGVRFLAARIGLEPAASLSPGCSSEYDPLLSSLQPPTPLTGASEIALAFIDSNSQLRQRHDVERFLFLLDDYVIALSPGTGANEPAFAANESEEPLIISKSGLRDWLQIPKQDRPAHPVYQGIQAAAQRWALTKRRSYDQASPALQARLAIFDFYWLTKIFDCEVSLTGWVSHASQDPVDWPNLLEIDSATVLCLRNGWVLACHWIQGISLETGATGVDMPSPGAATNKKWSNVFREELEEVPDRRSARNDPARPESTGGDPHRFSAASSLTGLAFSGGGIRSATFNLGVLEALRDLDLLRQFDYLSTVSGGGYIGAWLSANILRRPYWLRKSADWRASIAHLRRFSNYLAPRLGILSADAWTMLAVWSRNTLLVQLLVAFLCAVVLILPHLTGQLFFLIAGNSSFLGFGIPAATLAGAFTAIFLLAGAWFAMVNLHKERPPRSPMETFGQARTQIFVVIPHILAGFLIAALLWGVAPSFSATPDYSQIVRGLARQSPTAILIFLASLILLSFSSMGEPSLRKIIAAFASPFFALTVFYLCLCAIVKLFVVLLGVDQLGPWIAFTAGPSLVLIAFSIAGVILIGMLGRSSSDGQREWWSRLGAWLNIYGMAAALIPAIAIFGPYLLTHPFMESGLQWSAVAGWIATTAGSLFAAKSADTNASSGGQKASRLPLELLAAVGPYVFIAGFLALVALALQQLLMLNCDVCQNAGYWYSLASFPSSLSGIVFILAAAIASLLCWRLDINIFSLNAFYAYRLTRCYLGATRTRRNPGKFTGFDPADDTPLPALANSRQPGCPAFPGPFSIVNCTLNLAGASDLNLHSRQSASFTFTPLHAGCVREEVGFVPLQANQHIYRGQNHCLTLGTAIAVSGAAANPNMGYHTSTAAGFLLTLFNLRLGAWFPNPSRKPYEFPSPRFSAVPIVQELFGSADDDGDFLNISDGGHFENLGIYELVRRKCKVILASDAECDPDLTFGSLGNVIRLCQVDHGATITIDVNSIRRSPNGFSTAHCAIGKILYNDGSLGYLIYLKSSLTGTEDTAVREYKDSHPTFPHETTADQFFSEQQFESYRMLGHAIGLDAFRQFDALSINLRNQAPELLSIWTPNLPKGENFSRLGEDLQKIWRALRADPNLAPLLAELLGPPPHPGLALTPAIHSMCLEIFQLMENVYFDLALQDTWFHPDNSGWREQFQAFARTPLLQKAWAKSKTTFGERFRHFCGFRLNLP